MSNISYGAIDRFNSIINSTKGLLFPNRYIVTFERINSECLSVLANKVDLPSQDMVSVDFDMGGKVVHTPGKYTLGDLQITFYDTGTEYKLINSLLDKVFNYNTRAYGYYDDVSMDIIVTEFRKNGEIAVTSKYKNCIIKTISPVSLGYAEATEPKTFTASFSCGSVEIL